jgi:hypothetical protein
MPGVDRLQEQTRKEFHDFLSSYRIYSMSKRWDNLSMWQCYGDAHRGYCVEFKNLPFGKAIREVVYCDELSTLNWTVLEDNLAVYYCKHRDWSNEEEVRLVLPRRLGGPTFPLNAGAISRVILGRTC